MSEIIECVLFKGHSQKPKSVSIYKDLCNIESGNIQIKFKDYNFNDKIIKKYKVKLELLYSLDYDDEMFHFIGIKMNQIEKNDELPLDSEINKKEFWWENIYDRNYSLNVGDVIIVRYNSNGDLDNISPEDYNVLEKLIIQPETLRSDDEDSRTSQDLESTDEDYIPEEEDEDMENDEENDEEYEIEELDLE